MHSVRLHRFMKVIAFSTLFVAALMVDDPAQAQERGQYLPGFRGLNAGVQAPPGFTYANYFFWYPTSTLKNSSGDKVPLNFDLNLVADLNVFAYITKSKILGANYGFTVLLPFTNTAASLPQLGPGIGAGGIGDMYFEPINLGWKLAKGNVYASYGFMAPTGRFDPAGFDTTTTDFWGHWLTLAGTRNFGKMNLWQVSGSSVWEFHHGKRHEDVKVGENVTFEYGIGKTFLKNQGKQLIQFGAVGYAEFQLANDSGTDVSLFNQGNKDRVFALGPEFGVILPQKKFNLLVRALPEFGARSRTQGFTLVVAVGKTF